MGLSTRQIFRWLIRHMSDPVTQVLYAVTDITLVNWQSIADFLQLIMK